MLDKLETAYLAGMRVVVLVAATLALVVCILGVAFAAPGLIRDFGFAGEPKRETIDLAAYVRDQKLEATGNESDDGLSVSQTPAAPPKIREAAQIFATYAAQRSKQPVEADLIIKALEANRRAFDFADQDAYADSVRGLAVQVRDSTGKPLSLPRLAGLIDWHHSQFQAQIAARATNHLAEAARRSTGLILAAGGLGAFMLILFFFLVVKIERNLRLVRTREVAS
jgi:hypothetical protein